MKIEFETDEEKWALCGLIRDATAAILVHRLKESVRDGRSFNHHPGDRAYNKKFEAAAKIVLHHFGHRGKI